MMASGTKNVRLRIRQRRLLRNSRKQSKSIEKVDKAAAKEFVRFRDSKLKAKKKKS
jgi:hypothetical protein